MPWIVKRTNAYGSMSQSEMENNAQLQYNQIGTAWTLNAICGLLGNEQWESYINPGQWQGSSSIEDMNSGFGLVMWTPASKIFNIVGYDGVAQTTAIMNLTANDWIPTAGYPQTWEQFKASTEEPEVTAAMFAFNYERAGNVHLQERQTFARNWWNFFEGKPPGPGPGPEPVEKPKMPIVFYLRRL